MSRFLRWCLVALSAATLAAQAAAQVPREITFTIVDSQNGDCLDGEGWTSSAKSTYRLCSAWRLREPTPPVIPVLLEAGLTTADLKFSEATPRVLWNVRGSLLALRPGERLQFYLAALAGSSVEKKTGVSGTVTTIGDGKFFHQTSKGTFTDASQEGSPSASPAAEFIRTAKGGILYFTQGRVPGTGLSDFLGAVTIEPSDPGWRSVFVFTFTNEELARWASLTKANQGVVINADGQSINYRADLSVTQPTSDAEVEVSVDESLYPGWRPEGNVDAPDKPGNSLRVTLAAHASGNPSLRRRVRLSLSLIDVSEQKGVCLNWPQGGSTNVGLRFRKEDFPDGGPLTFVDEKHVETRDDERIERATVTVYAHDFGAWGTLRVRAKDEADAEAKTLVRGQTTTDLKIPKDDNANNIADSWEPAGVPTDKSWDGETVGGQDTAGDGLTLYNEYRGVVALDGQGKKAHQRLTPTEKELFIVDPQTSFPSSIWKRVSNITAIRLNDSLVKAASGDGAPLVDFNADDVGSHPVHAVKLWVISGDLDPTPPKPDGQTTADPSFPGMAYMQGDGSIKSTDYVKVFPDRVDIFLDYYVNWLAVGLKDPSSRAGTELRDPVNQFTVDEASVALARLRIPAERAKVKQRLLNVLFLHEFGHVCGGLQDHVDDPAPGEEARQCLMFRRGPGGSRRAVVFTALDRGDPDFSYPCKHFCRNVGLATYRCYPDLNVKDW